MRNKSNTPGDGVNFGNSSRAMFGGLIDGSKNAVLAVGARFRTIIKVAVSIRGGVILTSP